MLEEWIKDEIVSLCKQFACSKVILFGSRAREDNTETSDIDVAVSGSNDFDALSAELIYNEFTLLHIDVINLDARLDPKLVKNIEKDGVVIYEQ